MAYPATIDTMASVNSTQTLAQAGHTARHNELATTVNSLQSTLGVNPQGGSATVVARLNAIDSSVALKANAANPVFTGVVSIPTGSAAAPTLTFTGSTTNGVYLAGTNQLGLTTAGVLRATVDSTGLNVTGTIVASSTIAASGLAGSLLSSATPATLGTAAAGTSTTPARQDHVHSNVSVALTTPTLTTPTINGGTSNVQILISPEERWNTSATAAAATTTIDYLTAQNWYYTTASTAGACTINIRGNSGSTLASVLAIGDSVTLSFAITTGATTPAYFNAVQIDGTATGVTTRWQYAITPTSGTTSGVDMYTFTVLRTASGYTVWASVSKW